MSFVVVAFVIVVGVLRMYTMRRYSISSRWKSCSAASHVSGTIVYLHGNESRAELMVQYRGGFDFTAKAVKSTSVFLCWRSICHPRPMGRRKKGDLNQGLKHVQVDVNEKRNERVVCTYVRTQQAFFPFQSRSVSTSFDLLGRKNRRVGVRVDGSGSHRRNRVSPLVLLFKFLDVRKPTSQRTNHSANQPAGTQAQRHVVFLFFYLFFLFLHLLVLVFFCCFF